MFVLLIHQAFKFDFLGFADCDMENSECFPTGTPQLRVKLQLKSKLAQLFFEIQKLNLTCWFSFSHSFYLQNVGFSHGKS